MWFDNVLDTHCRSCENASMNETSTPCTSCGKPTLGGVHTNGDGYSSDAKHVGIEAPASGFFCWDCYLAGELPEEMKTLKRRINEAFEAAGMCGYLEAYRGRCRQQKDGCKHRERRCWKCGRPATSECSSAGSFVCGMPQCDDHPHNGTH